MLVGSNPTLSAPTSEKPLTSIEGRGRAEASAAILDGMALDEITEKLYRAADTSTLLGLLPLLRSQMGHVSAEMKHVARSEGQAAEANAQIAESYGELMTTLNVKVGDDPKGRELIQDIRDKINSAVGSLNAGDERTTRYLERLLGYSVDLVQRERWIIGEIGRRGYLPEFTIEE